MTDLRSLVVKNGTTQTIADADTLIVGTKVDSASTQALTVGGTNATSITIGQASITTDFPGPVKLTGDVTTVGGTTFTTDATFEGNVTFGNGPSDTVTFASTTTVVSDINFGGAPGTYKITNLANGTNPNDAVNYSQLSAIVSGVSSVGATAPLLSSGGSTPNISIDTTGASTGDVLAYNGAAWAATAPVTTPPGGAINNVQLNDGAGGFAGYAALTFDNTTTEMLVGSGTAHTIKVAPLGASGNPLIESDDSMNVNVANFSGALGLQAGGVDLVLVGGDDGSGVSYLQTQAGVRLETQGKFLAKNASDSTTAFDVQNAAGSSQIRVDTTNGKLFFAGVATTDTHTFNIGTNGTNPAFAIASGGRIHRYDGNTPAKGTLLAGDASAFATLSVGTDGQVLTADSAQTAGVKWATPTTGTVTSVDVSGGTTGLTTSGGPITGSGTITLAGTLGVANGGTGTTTAFTQGSVVFAGPSGVYAQDNANLFFDDSTDRLGVGVATPSETLSANGRLAIAETTVPSNTAGYGKLWASSADQTLHFYDNSIDYLVTPNTVATLTYAASVALDFAPSLPPIKSVALTGDITFTTSNLAASRNISVRVVGDTVSRNLVFPAGWTWLGGSVPTVLEANKTAILSIAAFSGADSGVIASWSYDGSINVTNVTASSPLASSGGTTPNISLTGTVAVANGGTGQSSLTSGALVVGNGGSAVNTLSPGTNGQVLTVVGGAWAASSLPAATDYSIVAIAGGTAGNATTVAGANAIATAASTSRVAGIAKDGSSVYVLGIIAGCNFDSSLSLAAGDAVYLSAANAGNLTNVAPSASGQVVAELGIIVSVSNAGGGAAAASVLWQPKSIVVL